MEAILQVVLRDARALVVQPLEDVIHRVSSVHDQKILIDRKDAVRLETLGDLGVRFETGDGELLLGVLILLHEDLVLNRFVAHFKLAVPWQNDLVDQAYELL